MALAAVPLTLLKAMVMLALICTVGWSVVALPLKLARAASLRFSAANLMLLVGLLLTLLRFTHPGYLSYHLALFCFVLAFSLVRFGLQNINHIPVSRKESLITLVVCAAALLTQPPAAASMAKLNIIFSLTAAWITLRATMELGSALRRHASLRLTICLSAAFALVASVSLLRAILLLQALANGADNAAVNDISSMEAVPFLWVSIGFVLLINSMLLGLCVWRLILTIREMSDRDGLTRTWSRRAIEERMAQEQQRQTRTRQSFALVMIDLDHFKAVNDTYGHAAGDAALKHGCQVVEKCLRKLDSLGRFGGEEFIALLPATDLSGAAEVAERMRAALAAAPLQWQQRSIALTASFGVAASTGPQDHGTLLRRADEALYRAKDKGRNRVETAQPGDAASQGGTP